MLDVRYYYALASLFNLIVLYLFWSWSLVFVFIFMLGFRVGVPSLLRLKKTMPDFRSLGEWAVVTGSTDGIGKEYALQMAKNGLGVVLISRNPQRLEDTAKEIKKLAGSGTKIKTVAIDFTEPNIPEKITEALSGLEIGVLINNVGMSYPKNTGRFLKVVGGLEFHRNIMRCNTDSLLLMTHAVLPQMIERKKGLIINVSSIASEAQPLNMSVYSGSKAFVTAATQAMQQEFAGSGVRIISVLPGFIDTKMVAGTVQESAFVPSPAAFVESHLKTVATIPKSYGFWSHELQVNLIHVLSTFFPIVHCVLQPIVIPMLEKRAVETVKDK